VAREYRSRRFEQPLGALLHDRQVSAVTRLIREYPPRRVLEIGPGPARLTTEIARVVGGGFLVDASAEMLTEARRRLPSDPGWTSIQGDAFSLPFGQSFDMVYSFRLLRHFDLSTRLALYRQIFDVLKPQGWLVFDAVNATVSAPLRVSAAPGEYEHYDALLRPDQLRSELNASGFDLVALEGVQRRYRLLRWLQVYVAPRSARLARSAMNLLDSRVGGEPLEWIVTCRRR
jgi:ubiquinone/menaquinone biosynthesis C-methylase UbiE